jgi:hypothetical protein
VLLTPFDSAVLLLRNKTDDVRFCISRAESAPDQSDVNFLTGQLKGVLDAAVQGGIGNYEVLLTGKYALTHPEIREELRCRYGGVMQQWRAAQAQASNTNTNGGSEGSSTSADDSGDEGLHSSDDDGQWDVDAPALAALRHALEDQMVVCAEGLVLHARKCKANMLPLHDYLCEKLASLCDRLETLGVPVAEAQDLGTLAGEASKEMQVQGTQAAATTG